VGKKHKPKKTNARMSTVQTWKSKENNDREMREIIELWRTKPTDEDAQANLTSIVNSAKNGVALGGSRNEFFKVYPEMAPKVLAINAEDKSPREKLREIADLVEHYTFGAKDASERVTKFLYELENSGRKMSFTDLVQIERESRGFRGEDNTKRLLDAMAREALTAKVNELHPKPGFDQGPFTGFADVRDAVISVATDEKRPLEDRCVNVSNLIAKMIADSKARIKSAEKELSVQERLLAEKKMLVEVLDALVAAHNNGGWKLQSNDCSRLHRLFEANDSMLMAGTAPKGSQPETHRMEIGHDYVPFIVKHDWAAVLGDSDGDKDGNVLLPMPKCAFEFRISGFNVIYLVQDPTHAGYEPIFPDTPKVLLVEAPGRGWIIMDKAKDFTAYVESQFHAACVVLEAQAAKWTKVEAPAALNKKRKSQGKLPLYDFHVIDLSRDRKRYENHGDGTGTTGIRHRLHFVRAHDRHYKDKGIVKRIPWHLRGDPELGVVDKLYKL